MAKDILPGVVRGGLGRFSIRGVLQAVYEDCECTGGQFADGSCLANLECRVQRGHLHESQE